MTVIVFATMRWHDDDVVESQVFMAAEGQTEREAVNSMIQQTQRGYRFLTIRYVNVEDMESVNVTDWGLG